MCKKQLQVKVLLSTFVKVLHWMCNFFSHYYCCFVTFVISFFVWFLSEQRIETVLHNYRWNFRCLYFCGEMIQRKLTKKKRKKEETPYRTCIPFLTGISIKEIIHFHIFAALNTDVLLLFSKDMLGVSWPLMFVSLISLLRGLSCAMSCVIWTWW